MNRLLARLLAATFAFAFTIAASAAERGLDIYFIDVEGGAATLLVTPAGESVLIDAGNPGMRDATRIHAVASGPAGLTKIDHFVNTHWHADHFGGVAPLSAMIPIVHFHDRGIPDSLSEDKQYFPILIRAYREASEGKRDSLKPGDTLSLTQASHAANLSALCLTASGKTLPAPTGAAENPHCAEAKPQPIDPTDNAKSVSLLIKLGDFTFLDCGDLTWNVERDLVCPRDPIGKVDVFQVTHHGLDASNNPVLVKTIDPIVAIFNNGPRKGAAAAVLRTLRQSPRLAAIYQLHRNVELSDDENTSPEFIANRDAECKGEFIRLSVAPDGQSYTVQVGAKGPKNSYATRKDR